MTTPCGKGFIVISRTEGKKMSFVTIPARCKKWSCLKCRELKSKVYKRRINSFFGTKQLWFYTLTFKHNVNEKEAWKNAASKWNRLNIQLRKRFGAFTYVRVLESHVESNYPHYHFLADRFFPPKEYGRILLRCGFGYQARVARVSGVGAGGYLAKYFTKGWPREDAQKIREELRLRLVSFSRGFPDNVVHTGDWKFLKFYDCQQGCSVYLLRNIYTMSLRGADVISYGIAEPLPSVVLDLNGYSPPPTCRYYEQELPYKQLSIPERLDLLDALGFDSTGKRLEFAELEAARSGIMNQYKP